jgi:glutamine synthetase
VIFGWDIADALYDNAKVTGWHTGFPDATATIDLDSFRLIPWEPGTAFFLLDFVNLAAVAPRQVLQRVIEKAAGYRAFFSAEYEFFFFRETPHSLREKNFHNLTPLSPGSFGYSVLQASENSELALELFDQLAAFVALEAFHTETGPGVYEAAIAVDEALAAADKGALFKTAVKEIFRRGTA